MKKHLVVSDIHGDLEALIRAADRAANDFGGFDDVWCLGDVLGRCEPEEAGACVEWLQSQSSNSVFLLGNWDWWILNKQPDSDDQQRHNGDLIKFREWLDRESNKKIKNYLVDVETGKVKWLDYKIFPEFDLTLVHGSPMVFKRYDLQHPSLPYIPGNDDARRVYSTPKDTDDYHIFDSMQRTPVYFTGHHHVPKIYTYFPNTDKVNTNEVYGDLEEKGFSRVSVGSKKRIIILGSVSRRDSVIRRGFKVPTAMLFDEETRKATIFEVK
jgi:predicted phosphodiesterase